MRILATVCVALALLVAAAQPVDAAGPTPSCSMMQARVTVFPDAENWDLYKSGPFDPAALLAGSKVTCAGMYHDRHAGATTERASIAVVRGAGAAATVASALRAAGYSRTMTGASGTTWSDTVRTVEVVKLTSRVPRKARTAFRAASTSWLVVVTQTS